MNCFFIPYVLFVEEEVPAHEKGGSEKWFRFDDSMVTLASEKDVLGVQAYLLFYIVRSLS